MPRPPAPASPSGSRPAAAAGWRPDSRRVHDLEPSWRLAGITSKPAAADEVAIGRSRTRVTRLLPASTTRTLPRGRSRDLAGPLSWPAPVWPKNGTEPTGTPFTVNRLIATSAHRLGDVDPTRAISDAARGGQLAYAPLPDRYRPGTRADSLHTSKSFGARRRRPTHVPARTGRSSVNRSGGY